MKAYPNLCSSEPFDSYWCPASSPSFMAYHIATPPRNRRFFDVSRRSSFSQFSELHSTPMQILISFSHQKPYVFINYLYTVFLRWRFLSLNQSLTTTNSPCHFFVNINQHRASQCPYLQIMHDSNTESWLQPRAMTRDSVYMKAGAMCLSN
jgi:hypothetical protein